MDPLSLTAPGDWASLRQRGLTTVVDPMIYRAGELFCGGRSKSYNPAQEWQALSANLGGLAAFVDAVIYNDRLPIFDYDTTFPEVEVVGAATGYRLAPEVNLDQQILVPVQVKAEVYSSIKQAALAELQDRPQIDIALRSSILSEMAAFRYSWEPALGSPDEDPDERSLSVLLFGGLLFAGYAQQLGGQHLLQPKRARLFGEIAFNTAADDIALNERLASLPAAAPDAVSQTMQLPQLPSFLPYLIEQRPRTTGELLRLALAQRTDRDVRAYRRWRDELSDELARGGNALKKRAEIDAVETRLKDRFTASGIEARLSVETVMLAVPVPKLEVSKSAQVRPREAWGWCVRRIKGDHRKTLTRLIGARQAFSRLDLALQEMWNAS